MSSGSQWDAPWVIPDPRPRTPAKVHLIWLAAVMVAAIGAGVAGVFIGITYEAHSQQIAAAVGAARAASGARPCTESQAPGSTGSAAAGQKLAAELLPVPAGQNPIPQQVLSPSQLIGILYRNQTAHATSWLHAICLRVSAYRGWTGAVPGAATWVWLLQFGTPADTLSYVLEEKAIDLSVPGHTEFTVSGVPGGTAVELPASTIPGDTVTWIHGYRGSVAITIEVVNPKGHSLSRSAAAALLRAQYARL